MAPNNKHSFAVVQVVTDPYRGGAQVLVRELHNRLPKLGILSYVVHFWNPRDMPLGDYEICLGLHSPRSPLAIIKLNLLLRRLLKNHEHLIVHTHLTWPFLYTAIATLKMGVSLVHTEHNTYNKRRRIKLFQPLERYVYRKCEKIICISKGTERQLLKWLDDKVSASRTCIIHNGAKMLPLKEKSVSDGKIKLISVGALKYQKGFDLSIQAVESLKDIVSKYVIVGEGPEELASIVTQVRKAGLTDIVKFPGWTGDITPYLHDADIMLIPSRWEGFGLVSVEALSAGLPVVAFRVAGLEEVLYRTDAAKLVRMGDVKAFSEAIRSFYSRLQAGFDFRESARKAAESFSLDKMAEQYSMEYAKISERRGWVGG